MGLEASFGTGIVGTDNAGTDDDFTGAATDSTGIALIGLAGADGTAATGCAGFAVAGCGGLADGGF